MNQEKLLLKVKMRPKVGKEIQEKLPKLHQNQA